LLRFSLKKELTVLNRDVPSDEIVSILGKLPTATIYEAAGKLGEVAARIRPIVDGLRLWGRAFTVKAMPGDNLVVFRAIDEAPAGSVLVIDAGDTVDATIWGGTSTCACIAKKINGCVTNAAVRDVAQIRKLNFPVFAAGINVRGTVKSHPGWTQIPISFGAVPVKPGDIVIGDEDGLVIVAAEHAEEVLKKSLEKQKNDEAREARLLGGEPIKSVLKF
jgi:4-hydroxy-4-methyl-2-oxoglutarate aldolase